MSTPRSLNLDLSEERVDAYRVGYVGTLRGHAVLSVSACRNATKHVIDFNAYRDYTVSNPPADGRSRPTFSTLYRDLTFWAACRQSF